MKLRNKRTGEIYDFKITPDYDDVTSGWKIENKDFGVRYYSHLAELNAEWEDYEEPKEYWFMDYGGRIKAMNDANDEEDVARKQIGNYFETKEEAEKTVEKLKAWKRLKDKGFRFKGLCESVHELPAIEYDTDVDVSRIDSQEYKDLDLIFGGEE